VSIQGANLFAELQAVRRLVFNAVVDRGFPARDAHEVAREVLSEIIADLAGFADVLAASDDYAEYFDRMAMAAYFRLLDGELQRRRDTGTL